MTRAESRLATAAILLAAAGGLLGCHLTSTGSAGAGGQCRVNTDCTGGKICTSGVCVAPAASDAGATCLATRECAAGLYCDGTGVCASGGSGGVGASCTTDGQCVPPLRCTLAGFTGVCATSGTGEVGSSCQAHAACLSGLWCARDQTCQPIATAFPPFSGAACADEGAFRAYFEVPRPGKPPADFFRLPFPNDLRVSGGQLDIRDFPTPGQGPLGVDFVRLYADAWSADFDGFSTIAPVTFRFSAPIDFATATGDAVLFIDLTPGTSLGAALARNWAFNSPRAKYICANRLVVRGAIDSPLQPRHTYAVILTTAIHSTTGAAAVADADLALLLASTAPTTDATLAAAWVIYQPLRDWLASRGTAAPAVSAAAVFTAADAAGHAQRVAAAAAAQPAPVLSALKLCDAGVISPCDDTSATGAMADGGADAGTSPSERACVAADPKFYELHGKLSVPIFQQGTPPYETTAAGGGILETAGVPQVARTEAVCFALAIPKGVAAPASGWPLVVYHHDTGGSMRSMVTDGIAAALAGGTPAAAVLGFDAVEHGARRGASTTSPEQLIFNLINPRAARDNYLQGAVDVVQALRVAGVTVSAAASPTGAAITFNPAAVAFFGRTQGSTSGELALPFTDAAGAAVLSGAGAFMTSSLLDRRSPVDLSAGLTFAAGEPLDAGHPVMTLLQSFFDRIDPLNTNPLTLNKPPTGRVSKHVFMTWGVGDTYTPSSTMQPNAVTLHIPAIRPLVETAELLLVSRPVSLDVTAGDGKMRTGVLAQYMPAGGGAGGDAGVGDGGAGSGSGAYDGNFVALRDPAAIADWSAFLHSYFATGTPTIP